MAGPWHQTFLTDLSDVQALNRCADDQRVQDLGAGIAHGAEDRLSARRIHKADREKLRRDKLNEQFSELANALDPDRPKNDKATILGESIQIVKELREEVKRLKTEHSSLLDESADLTQEKNELREERTTLKTETERLHNQLQQRLRPWMTMDPSLVMGAAAPYPYSIPIPQPVSLGETDSSVNRPPLVNPTSFIPMAPAYHMHHPLQPYAMFGNRPIEGGNPYMPFPTYPHPPAAAVTSHSHIERPYAQYPPSVQTPIPGYVVQVPSGLGSQSQPTAVSPTYRPFVPGIPVMPLNHDSSQVSKDSSDLSHTAQSSSPAETDRECTGAAPVPVPVSSASQEAPVTAKDCNPGCVGLQPSSPSVNSSTSHMKEKIELSIERTNLNPEGRNTDLINIRHSSQDYPDNGHDPTLRPPAA